VLAVLRDPTNAAPIAVTPLVYNRFPLTFSVAGKTLTEIKIPGYHLSGNIPLFPKSLDAYQALITRVFDSSNVQCLYIHAVAKDSIFNDILSDAGNFRTKLLIYNPDNRLNRYYFIEMPACYDEYCKIFKSKALYNMKRELRLLEKQAGGRLDLIKVTMPDQVAAFLVEARKIAENSRYQRFVDLDLDQPADRQGVLEAMAKRGVLRCYLLRCGQQARAYVIGSQLEGVFYFHETAYDKAWARYSPGKSLLQLILKECFESETPRIFFFTGGDASYKKWFSNRMEDKVSLLIFRENWANWLLIMVHRLFRSTVGPIEGPVGAIFNAIRSKRRRPC
jgi:hypothetical protein